MAPEQPSAESGERSKKDIETFFREDTPLSGREAEVLALTGEYAEQYETDEQVREAVADELGIAPSTVETYYYRALNKLAQYVAVIERTDSELPEVSKKVREYVNRGSMNGADDAGAGGGR